MINVDRFLFLFVFFLFYISLVVSYYFFVHEIFSYAGFDGEFVLSKFVVSFFVVLIAFSFLDPVLKKPSDFLLLVFFTGFVVPVAIFYSFNPVSPIPFYLTVIVFLFIYTLVSVKVKSVAVPAFSFGPFLAMFLSFIFVIYLIFWYLHTGAYRFMNFNLLAVYESRSTVRELTSIGLFAYFNHWAYSVFNVFLMAVSLHYKKYLFFCLFALIQVFFFSVSAHKSLLFFPFVIFSIWFYFSRTDKLLYYLIGLIGIVSFSFSLFIFFNEIVPASLFIRRVFFVPAGLAWDYYSFFSVNELYYWSNSFLSPFLDSPYVLSPGRVIGEYNGSGSNANMNFLFSGFAHAGLIGSFFYAFVLAIFLRFVNGVTKGCIPVWLATAIVFIPFRNTLINSDLATSFLTHGLLVLFILLFLYRYKRV